MLINWLKFVPALLLLLVPIGIFHGKKVRYREISRDWGDHLVPIFSLGLHLIDALRAALGAWLLIESLSLAPGAKGFIAQAPLLTRMAVLWLGVLLQTTVCRERDAMHAPFAWVLGVVAVLMPPLVATFAVILALATTAGSRVAAAFFPALAVALAAIGVSLVGKSFLLPVAVVAIMLLLPWLLPVLFNSELVISYRAKRADDPTRLRAREP
jgi:hypothetical protein